jgi:hypothetical protein
MIQWLLDASEHLQQVTSDLFWNTATSMPVLLALGIIALAAFVVAHAPLIGQLFPTVAAWQRLAMVVEVVSIVALIFLVGFRVAADRSEAEQLRSDLAWSQFQLGLQQSTARDAQALREKADGEAQEAKGTLNEYQSKFGNDPKTALCPPPDGYLDWVRELQRRKTAAAVKPRRGLVARLRAIGGQRK